MSAIDVGTLLTRALERSADGAGVTLAVVRSGWSGWASATFTGARHALDLTLADDPAAAAWLADLPEAELTLRGQLVADLKVIAVTRSAAGLAVTIEVLTVEDR